MSESSTILAEAFDIDNTEGSKDFEPLPVGNYVASIKEAVVNALKTGRGEALMLQWEIEGGEYANRLIFDRVIVNHENADAQRIGREKIKDICVAVGVAGRLTDLKVLENKPVSIRVVIEQDEAGLYPPKNLVRRVKPIARPDSGNGAVKPDFNDAVNF